MLIDSPRIRAPDREAWAIAERADAVQAQRIDWGKKCAVALDVIEYFARQSPCYAGVSWGKDSTVLAHLVHRAATERGVLIPIVWVRVHPRTNPDCVAVRDAFLSAFPCVQYREIDLVWNPHDRRRRHQLWDGFRRAATLFGTVRYLSGIRAEESAGRRVRMRTHGVVSAATCAPLIQWRAPEVFAYMYQYGLPVHPAYACTMGGDLDRGRIRVGTIGGARGYGREGFEQHYYPDILRELQRVGRGAAQ